MGATANNEVVHNKISQHNIVEKGLVGIQILIDPKSVVESTISWSIDNYINEKYIAEMEESIDNNN